MLWEKERERIMDEYLDNDPVIDGKAYRQYAKQRTARQSRLSRAALEAEIHRFTQMQLDHAARMMGIVLPTEKQGTSGFTDTHRREEKSTTGYGKTSRREPVSTSSGYGGTERRAESTSGFGQTIRRPEPPLDRRPHNDDSARTLRFDSEISARYQDFSGNMKNS